MAELLDELNQRVTEAIFRAEHEPEGSPAAEAAYRQVSELEERIARVVAADDVQGGLARVGAVTAALRAGDWLRAAWLAESFAVDAPPEVAEQLHGLAVEAEMTSNKIPEPSVRPISFTLLAA